MPKNETSAIPKLWAIPNSIKARLGREAGPQRAIFEEDHLLLILHHPPLPDQHLRVPALFWRQNTGEWRCTEGRGGLSTLRDLMESYEKNPRSRYSRNQSQSRSGLS